MYSNLFSCLQLCDLLSEPLNDKLRLWFISALVDYLQYSHLVKLSGQKATPKGY